MTSLLIVLFTVIGFFMYQAFSNTKRIAVNYVTPNTSKLKGSTSLKVLQISDMHIENISISPDQLYRQLRQHPIDLIVLTGDFLDRKKSIPKLIPYLEVFQKLNPLYGTYAVFGNHDYFLRPKNFISLKKTLNDFGCVTLENESKAINCNGNIINIIGIDDYSTKRSDTKKSFINVTDGYNLVLTHDPNIILSMEDYSFDYLLAGHFHGGQIHWPKPYHLAKLGRKMMKLGMIKGLHSYQGKAFYISEGLGQTGLNIRIGSRPEITIHQLDLYNVKNKVTQAAI